MYNNGFMFPVGALPSPTQQRTNFSNPNPNSTAMQVSYQANYHLVCIT